MVSHHQILKLADQIAHRFNPEGIILFGSYAYGAPTPDSDVDLLILMPCAHKTMEMEFEIRQAVRAPFAFDVLVRTPAEIAERIALNDCFITEVLGKGKVLYEAADARMGRQGGSGLPHRSAGVAGKKKPQSRRGVLSRPAVR